MKSGSPLGPTCGFEINTRRIRQNPRITIHTLATVAEITGRPGNFDAYIRIKPKYVTGEHPIEESIIEKITSERDDEFNQGLNKTKALYSPHDMAYPSEYLLDKDVLSESDAELLLKNCPKGAIDFEMAEQKIEVNVGAVIIAIRCAVIVRVCVRNAATT